MSEPSPSAPERPPPSEAGELEERLLAAVRVRFPEAQRIAALRRLSGGASQESWSFDVVFDSAAGAAAGLGGGRLGLILRRAPGRRAGSSTLAKEAEAKLQVLARRAGVPVAEIHFVLAPEDGLGAGYVMERVEGESIARRILRGEAFACARARMARQCGEILGRIHALDRADLPELRRLPPRAQLDQYRQLYDGYADPHPVFEWAFRWLAERVPEARALRLVHGDFRNGNFIVDADGVAAVLDWELAHLGDPMEDLGWICVNSWRFGVLENPVGGFGKREDMFAGYETAGGGSVDPRHVRWWEIFGSLKWGIMCMGQGFSHLLGHTRSVEKAAIGRRSSETEVDLLHLILVEEGL